MGRGMQEEERRAGAEREVARARAQREQRREQRRLQQLEDERSRRQLEQKERRQAAERRQYFASLDSSLKRAVASDHRISQGDKEGAQLMHGQIWQSLRAFVPSPLQALIPPATTTTGE